MLIHALEADQIVADQSGKIPENYLIVLMKISNRVVRCLVDTGAQPTVIKQSCVLIGTPIVDSNMYIKGVKGPPVQVCGTANIHMEVGGHHTG